MQFYNLARYRIKDTILMRVHRLLTPNLSLAILLLKQQYHYHLNKLVILEKHSTFLICFLH